MKIHEFQSKQILVRYNVPVPPGGVAASAEEAVKAARDVGGASWVVKAQIHAGGRGKGGGIRVASNLQEVRAHAGELLGTRLVTAQTGPQGSPINRVLVEGQMAVEAELYAGVVVDRSKGRGVLLVSSAGGMEIEEVAKGHPETLFRETLGSDGFLQAFQARRLTYKMRLSLETGRKVQKVLQSLGRVFYREDCTLAEINPLVITRNSEVLALDAKLNLDDNASFRHPEWQDLKDPEEDDPMEREASRYGLNYIRLEGDIGCMVNGAGLAMATMDMIKGVGGSPANFLDVGGGASEEAVSRAFRILVSDPNVRVVLINIFGGIVRCDVIARGVLNAASQVRVNVPMVVRLEGTNVEEGRRILESSALSLDVVSGMREAAERAVALGRR